MKNLTIIFLFLMGYSSTIKSQNWTEPVNVSNMGGFNQMPDFCFDNNGVIHCAWVHVYELNFSKIFYSKSFDDGMSWIIAQDISFNTEKRLANPHLVCDSENILHLTYDFDIGNYLETLIFYKKFDGSSWSEPIIVSENMPESHANKLVIDNNDRVYCFWFSIINNENTFYRYLENGIWSETFSPYNNNDYLTFINYAVDNDNNNLHWIGACYHEGQTAYNMKPVYFYYNYDSDLWSDYIEFGKNYSWYGFDIDLDSSNLPHLVWQEFTNNNIPPNDGTFYSFYNGINWSLPELIVEDPKNQQIIIDNNNKPNIFDNEKSENGYKLVYYYPVNYTWPGFIIDETPNAFFDLRAQKYCNKIYLLYTKSILIEEGQIFISKMDMINNTKEISISINDLNVFPNPFSYLTKVVFNSSNNFNLIRLEISDLSGKLIKTLINEKINMGKYEIIWNGKDLNGKDVTSGLYLVRLQSGRNILTRSVEYIK